MLKKVYLLLALFAMVSSTCFADVSGNITDPSELGVGARPLGMGKAFAGFSNDASSIFMNPAGLADIKNFKGTSMSGQVISDINYYVLGGATPTDWGTFGVGYINVGLPNIPVTTITGTGTTAAITQTGLTNYSASVTTVTYANNLYKIPLFSNFKDVNYGINLKMFQQGFTGGGSSMYGANGSGYDVDLGFQYKANKSLTLGLTAINILSESMGGRFVWDKGGETEAIPSVIKIGGTAKLFGKDSYYGSNQNVFAAIDVDMRPDQNMPSVLHLGVEWWPISIMALRAGVDQNPRATDAGVGVDNNLTAGIGLKFNGYTFDYAYHQYSDLNENTTHYFSIGFVGLDDDRSTKPSKGKVFLPVIVQSATLETFSDVPSGYWAKSPIEFMATLGVMNGFQDGQFKPDDTVSRAELATMLIKLKNVEVNEAYDNPYPDVSKDFWAAKYIKAVSYLNLMKNYPDGTFKPERKISRVEGVVIISRFTDAEEPKILARDPFADVSKTHWAALQIAAAQNYGILDYLIGKKFDPNKELTRAEVAEMLAKTSYGKERIRKYLNASMELPVIQKSL